MAKKDIYSKVIDRTAVSQIYPDQEDPKLNQKLAQLEEKKKLKTIAELVAENQVYHRNWKWPEADKHFPLNPDMRVVGRYFPYAKGGPLYVDEPKTKEQIDQCYLKQKFLKKQGLRHIVIEPDTDLYHALDQIGEA